MEEIEGYKIIEEIGKGVQGSVYKVINKNNNKYYAIKIVEKNRYSKQELKILIELKNVCIKYLLCYENFYLKNNKYYIITEYLYGYVTVLKYVENDYYFVDEKMDFQKLYENFNKIFEGLCKGLKIIHGNNIVHRDISCNNLLIDPITLNIKYIDFGLSNTSDDIECVSGGTTKYIAPETYLNELCDFNSLKKSDIYSVGVLIFYIISTRTPMDIKFSAEYKNLKLTTGGKIGRFFTEYKYSPDQMVDNVINKVNELRVNKIIMKNLLSGNLEMRDYYCEK